MPVRLELLAVDPTGARAGVLHTRRGPVETPTFMPVGTHANVRNLTCDEVGATGAKVLLANTYHLLLQPGPEVFQKVGGIHPFMRWDGAVLTDSGGYQIFSLEGEREIFETGAHFRSYLDNSKRILTPEVSIATQQAINSEIMMVLDVCIDSTSDEKATRFAMERTHRWALRSLAARNKVDSGQALFAIVQGGVFPALRSESAGFLTQHPFDGFAIGGLAVGEERELLYSVTAHTAALLPINRPRYLMGVGTPLDLLESVRSGVDMFDCIIPTKMAQQGYAYTFDGLFRLRQIAHRLETGPIEEDCPCLACQRYTRAYIRHLLTGEHGLGTRLLAIHNVQHYQRLMARMRAAILEGRFDAEYRELKERVGPKKRVKPAPRLVGPGREGDYEIITLRSGARAVKNLRHGEVMHPMVGPWEEANFLYVEQTGLRDRLVREGDGPLRIYDVGLGAGANAAAALSCAAQTQGPKRALELVSFENDLSSLKLALSEPDSFPFLKPWAEAVRALLETGSWRGESVSWTLHHGDFLAHLAIAKAPAELVFFDPFSPETNPAFWTRECLARLRRACREDGPGAVLATYSSATPTRVAMLLAGFYVGAGRSVGPRAETTIAATRRELLAAPLGDRWLDRWRRSSARAPHGELLSNELEAAVTAHPQWALTGS